MVFKILTKPTAKVIILILMILCCLAALSIIQVCVLLFNGDVEINLMTDQTPSPSKVFLKGGELAGGWLTLPEEIYLTAPDNMIADASRVGVYLIGMVRLVPTLVCLIVLCAALFNIFREKLFCMQNITLLFVAGSILLLTSILAPIINRYIIPPVVSSLSANTLATGVNMKSAPHLWWGIALVLMAYVLKQGLVQNDDFVKH
ncbi:MAG: hypothetical protein AAGU74_09590 [Bacillota bacterium]